MKNPSILAAAAFLAACGTVPAPVPQPLMTAPSPISFDGNVAFKATDEVFVLVPDADPNKAGFWMRAGESLRLALPAGFRRNTSVAVVPDMDTNLVLTKGWAQGSVRLAEQYRVGFDGSKKCLDPSAWNFADDQNEAAAAIAREVGAPAPTSTAAPATSAFWTSSKESRPETQSTKP